MLNSGAESAKEGLQPSKGRRLRPLSSTSNRRRLSAKSARKRLQRAPWRAPWRAPNSPMAPSAASSSSIIPTQHLQPRKVPMSCQNKLQPRRTRTRRSTPSTATSAGCGQPPAPSRGSPLCCSGKASFRHDLACEDAPRAAQRDRCNAWGGQGGGGDDGDAGMGISLFSRRVGLCCRAF